MNKSSLNLKKKNCSLGSERLWRGKEAEAKMEKKGEGVTQGKHRIVELLSLFRSAGLLFCFHYSLVPIVFFFISFIFETSFFLFFFLFAYFPSFRFLFFFFCRSTDAKTIFILQSNFCFLSPQLNQFSIPPVLLFLFFFFVMKEKYRKSQFLSNGLTYTLHEKYISVCHFYISVLMLQTFCTILFHKSV